MKPSLKTEFDSYLKDENLQTRQISSGIKGKSCPFKKIRETIVSSYNAGVSEAELLKKRICDQSPAAVYNHYICLREKEIITRKLVSCRKQNNWRVGK